MQYNHPMEPHKITFKPLEEQDFPLLHKWLTIDFVTRWYDRRKFLYDDVEKEHTFQKIDTPIESYLVQYEGESIGYIHTYRVHDYPEYALEVLVDRHTAGIDMFIGERGYVGQGLGPLVLQSFLKHIVFQKEGIDKCIVGIEPDNHIFIRVYEKAGFKPLKQIEWNGGTEYVMEIRKEPEDHLVFNRDM